jgi:hypothetical protein
VTTALSSSLARLIQKNQPVVALTGAGVSTETSRKPRCAPYGELHDRFERMLRSRRQCALFATGPKAVPNHLGRRLVAIASRNRDAEEIIPAYGPVIRGSGTIAERSR